MTATQQDVLARRVTFKATVRNRSFTNYNGDSAVSIDIDITDPEASGNCYVIEVVKQPVAIYGYFYFDGNEYSITQPTVPS